MPPQAKLFLFFEHRIGPNAHAEAPPERTALAFVFVAAVRSPRLHTHSPSQSFFQ